MIGMVSAQSKGTKINTRAPACPYIHLEIFYGNRVSKQFGFSVNSLNADMYLTHPCQTEFLCLILPHVMSITNIYNFQFNIFLIFSITFY